MEDVSLKIQQNYDENVKAIKQARKDLDLVITNILELPRSRETDLCCTKIEEGIMWLGKELKRLGESNPYPDSYDPTNTKIEPTADGLKN